MEKQIWLYFTRSSRFPFKDWLDGIKDPATLHLVRSRLNRLKLGHYGDCKSVGHGVFELRIHCKAGYRIYFGEFKGEVIVLLAGGNKSSQYQDIARAKIYWLDFKERCNE